MNEKVFDLAKIHKSEQFAFQAKDEESWICFSLSKYHPPSIIEEFICKLKIYGKEHAYVFEIMTYGGEDQYI